MNQCELTILMPCLNEAETLATCITKAQKFLSEQGIVGEVLVADNGSTDGSIEMAQSLGVRVIDVPVRGYGAALKNGIHAAKGRYIIMGDADDSYDFLKLMPFLTSLRHGADLVIGNRFRGGIQQGAMPFLNRYVGNPILSFLGRLFFQSRIGDFHCGLRGFCRDKITLLNLQGDGMEFASEMIMKAVLHKLTITEVPTCLYPDGRSRPPHLRPWRDGWRHLRLLLLFSPRWLFLYPGLFLMLCGLGMMSALIAGPVAMGLVHFDIHSMLFGSLFMISGLQAVCFAVFAYDVRDAYLEKKNKNFSLLRYFTLERGLFLGFLLIAAGLVGSLYALSYWQQHAYGNLPPTYMMRVVIPSVTAMISGLQLAFSSFFLTLLRVIRRK